MTRYKRLLPIAVILVAGCTPQSPLPPTAQLPGVTPPVLDSVQFHTTMARYLVVYPEFHFHSLDGDVEAIHRELISTTSPERVSLVSDAPIMISPEQQKRGAVYVGGWHCGAEPYVVNIRAYLIDHNDNHSNSVDYTIHCDQ